eukprot:TRINITY_DN27860_c0_g2_i1.p1 TRINITY_DN27860_c0_g2~~TRINITY_DN27860_c0_g2_i1.p1  ORF type:complete len:454 (-),score=104.02 TRINITY_DN27860_c0_g2_i1:176-1537(-)
MPDTVTPPGTFVTCAADNTIRVWNLESDKHSQAKQQVTRSLYCREMLVCEHVEVARQEEGAVSGLRCLAVSPDGVQLACGDHAGSIHVRALSDLQPVQTIPAHDGEVMKLNFTASHPIDSNECLLASAGRDRVVHLLQPSDNYARRSSVSDHTGAVTSVHFALENQKLLSCSTDKSIRFRDVDKCLQNSPAGGLRSTNSTIYDMDVDATHKYVVTANQDKRLNVWSASSSKSVRTYRLRNSGEPYKVQLDPAGIFVATSSSDKLLRIYDFFSGECLAKAGGHSEQITRLIFTRDCRRLISVSADGCIFVHKLSSALTKPMLQRLAELQTRPPDKPAKHVPAAAPEQSAEPEPPMSMRSRAGESSAIAESVSESVMTVGTSALDDQDDCSVVLSDGDESETSFQYKSALLPGWARAANQASAALHPQPGAAGEQSKPVRPQGCLLYTSPSPRDS